MAELNTRIVLRNDTSANWLTNEDVVLLKSEVGVEFTADGKVKMKIGDGVKSWKELPYWGGEEGHTFEATLEEGESHPDAIARVVGATEPVKGDSAIVKEPISTGHYSYTAYVYNGTAWAAMDGNYNAENVYFSEDMLFTYAFGKYKLTNGNVTIPSAGKNLKELLMGAHVDIINPTKTAPGFSLITSGNISQEVGTTYTLPTATATFNDGKYTYGYVDAEGNKVSGTDTAAGITASEIEVTCDQSTDVKTVTNANSAKLTMTSANLKDTELQDLIVDDTSITYNFTAECTYPASTRTPTNNVGETSNSETGVEYTPQAGGSWTIDAGTKKTASATVSGWRKMFMGTMNAEDELNSANIRALSLVNKQTSKTAQTFTVPVGAQKIVVAYPKIYTSKAPKFEYFTMSWENFSGFVQTTDVEVADYRGGDNGKVAYTVYTFTHANPAGFEAATQYRVTLQ